MSVLKPVLKPGVDSSIVEACLACICTTELREECAVHAMIVTLDVGELRVDDVGYARDG